MFPIVLLYQLYQFSNGRLDLGVSYFCSSELLHWFCKRLCDIYRITTCFDETYLIHIYQEEWLSAELGMVVQNQDSSSRVTLVLTKEDLQSQPFRKWVRRFFLPSRKTCVPQPIVFDGWEKTGLTLVLYFAMMLFRRGDYSPNSTCTGHKFTQLSPIYILI